MAAPYGSHLPFSSGFDATSHAKLKGPNASNASGFLQDAQKNILYLWIENITADFSINGAYAQSRMTREWFPRSFNDVTLTITGRAASTQQYNQVAAFVRNAQWTALQQINSGHQAPQTITFHLYDRTPKVWNHAKRAVKGRHRPWLVDGYVRSISAGAVTQEVAPVYTISFIVAESKLTGSTGIWSDTLATVTPLQSMLQIIGTDIKKGTGDFITDPVAAEAGSMSDQTAVQSGVWSVAGAVSTLNLPFTF